MSDTRGGWLFIPLGLLASLLSDTRGGWLFIPLGLLICVYWVMDKINKFLLFGVVSMTVLLLGIVYMTPQTGVEQRIKEAITEVVQYKPNTNSANTSVGARLEMWRASLDLIEERPLMGWGKKAYMSEMEKQVQNQSVASVIQKFGHPHNELLNEVTKKGIGGGLALLLLYIVPLYGFVKNARSDNIQIRTLSLMGGLLVVAYIVFGLTQAFLSHNNGILNYLLCLSVFYGAGCYIQRQSV